MRIAHISDTHGMIPVIDHLGIDAIIHSGDFIPDPDMSRGSKKEVLQYWQRKWVWDNMETLKERIAGRPFLFVLGNHDHEGGAWLEAELKKESINAICLHNKVVSFGGLNWLGFPWVDHINGWHSYELEEMEMQEKIDAMVEAINGATYVDCLVMHQPPYKILDQDLRNMLWWGNDRMNDALWNKIDVDKVPATVLCGHCHSSSGIRVVSKNDRSILFSNAATTQHILETG